MLFLGCGVPLNYFQMKDETLLLFYEAVRQQVILDCDNPTRSHEIGRQNGFKAAASNFSRSFPMRQDSSRVWCRAIRACLRSIRMDTAMCLRFRGGQASAFLVSLETYWQGTVLKRDVAAIRKARYPKRCAILLGK